MLFNKEMEKTIDKIFSYIKENSFVSVSDLTDEFGINRQMVHRHLKRLLEQGRVVKHGKAPKVFYAAAPSESSTDDIIAKDVFYELDEKTKKIIEGNFLLIEPTGKKKEGALAFITWCRKRNFSIKEKAKEYKEIFEKYEQMKEKGFLNGSSKLKTFGDNCLDGLFYMDFYAWEVFGKTKLGQLLLYAKQSQNKKEIIELIDSLKPKIDEFIKKQKIDAVGFIPPTLKRENQFMKILGDRLNVALPVLSIVKIKTEVIVPQKTLSKLSDRLENAEKTIMVDEKRSFKKVLLIDDAVGSGATLYKTACKFKKNKLAKVVFGISITGSLKGFDVISEV